MSNIQVQTDSERCERFSRKKIVESLVRETDIDIDEAIKVARSIRYQLDQAEVKNVSTGQIRQLVISQLVKREMKKTANQYESIGVPVSEIENLVMNGTKDNSNLAFSPETTHKAIADEIGRKYALTHMFPSNISKAHLNGQIHLSDLDYCYDRPINCLVHNPVDMIRFGLKVDGTGKHTSIASPAKRLLTLVQHLGQALQASQTNMAGGQALGELSVMCAPFVTGLSDDELLQMMQMFIYSLNMSFCSRGGQSLDYNAPLIIKTKTGIEIIPIGEFEEVWENNDFETLSLNVKTGKYEWKKITNTYKHKAATSIIKTRLHDGRFVKSTTDHSLFGFDENANIVEVKPSENLDHILTVKEIPFIPTDIKISDDELFTLGIAIGDGNLVDNNYGKYGKNTSLSINLNPDDIDVQKRIEDYSEAFSTSKFKKHSHVMRINLPTNFMHPLFKKIKKGSQNKEIPAELLGLPKNKLHILLDGLFSSDGSIRRNRLEYSTTSKKLFNQLQFIFLRLGFEFGSSKYFTKSNFKRNFPVYRILISAKDSHKIGLTCKRKECFDNNSISQHRHDYSIIKPILNRPKRLPNGQEWKLQNQWTNNRKLKYSGLEANNSFYPEIWNKVKNSYPMEIESQEIVDNEEYVYDISVEDNENFVLANGIVAHNSIFSSVNLEFTVPNFLKDVDAYGPSGKKVGVYEDFEEETRRFTRAFTQIMLEGDTNNNLHRFPNSVYILRKEMMKPEFEEDLKLVCELSSKYSIPYFLNLLPKDGIEAASVLGCRSRLNDNWKGEYESDIFTGNATYNTINMNRIALESKEESYYDILNERIDLLREASYIRKDHSIKLLKNGNMPFLTQEIGGKPYYNIEDATVSLGFCGINEALINMGIEEGMISREGQKEALKMLKFFNKKASEFNSEDGYRWSIIATPAETLAGKCGNLDKQKYPKSFINGTKGAYYLTNGSMCSVDADISILDRVKIESKYHPLSLGGNISNIHLGTAYPEPQALFDLTKIISKTDLGFFAYSSINHYCYDCNTNGKGLIDNCPNCGSRNVTCIDRVTGYLSTIGTKTSKSGWNASKISELNDRKRYNV